jgi:ABC-type sugar transport system substrate-binding protein
VLVLCACAALLSTAIAILGSAAASAKQSRSASAAAGAIPITATPTKAMCGGKTYTFGYDVFSDSQEFAVARWSGMQHWQKVLGCIKWIKMTDNGSGTTALSNVQILANQNVNAMLLLQVDASAQAGIVKLLKAKHIPVLASDIPAPGAPFFSASDAVAGTQAGQGLVAAYKHDHLTQKPYVVLVDTPVAGPQVAKRMRNAKAAILKAFPGLPSSHFVKVNVSLQTATEAYNNTKNAESLIPAGVPVLVTGVNDNITLGAYQALHAAHKGKPLIVIGIGGLNEGLQAVCKDSAWAGTVDFAPYRQTGYIVSELLRLAQGKSVPSTFFSPTQVVNRAMVKKLYPSACH